jgi:hypothetical protein
MNKQMKAFLVAAALTGGISGTSNASDLSSMTIKDRASVVANESMKCMTIYGMLGEAAVGDDFSTHILNSQATFMSTVHIMSSPEETKEEIVERYLMGYEFTRGAMKNQYDINPGLLVDTLYQCEGWREDLVKHIAANKDLLEGYKTDFDMRSFYQRMPHPKKEYSLEGATKGELLSFVMKGMSELERRGVFKQDGIDSIPNPFN